MKTNRSQKNNSGTWQTIPVGDVFTFIKSYAFSRDNLSNGILSGDKIGNIHYGDIHAAFTSKNIDLSKVEIPIVKEAGFNPKKGELLKDGDLIMADVSEDYDGIGVTVSVHGIGKNKVVGGLHTFVLRDEKGKTSEYYRQYIFLNKEIRNKLQKVANGVSVYGISKTALLKIELPLPSISEQNRIISVLEIWDKSIEKLTHKIETKKQIKKGLMHDLLSGKKRLSGFEGKWEIVKLGEIGTFKGGNGFPEIYQGDKKGDYPFFKVSDMNNLGNEIKMISSNNWIDYDKKSHIKPTIFPINTIVIAKIGAAIFLERKRLLIQESCLDNNMMGFILKNGNINFIYYKFLNIRFSEFANITALPSLSGSDLSEVEIKLPNTEEQNAIAEILITADKEITNLEKKLTILKEQKRYLLNNLITGKIRTPETLSTKL